MGTNRYGVDASYFSDKIKLILRDIDNYTGEELATEFTRLADTANPCKHKFMYFGSQTRRRCADCDELEPPHLT